MKYEEARIGQQVMVGNNTGAEIDGLDDDLKLIHVKPLEDDQTVIFHDSGYTPVEGWRQAWQYELLS
jgi:hypothetical protein